MLPTVNASTEKSVAHGNEVAGRVQGVAAMANLVSDAGARGKLEESGNRILAAARDAWGTYTARLGWQVNDRRLVAGKGRAVDRGFDACVAGIAEKARTALPDRNTANPEFRAIFPTGSIAEFVQPAIHQDGGVAATLRQSIDASRVPNKAELLAMLDGVIPIVTPAADAYRGADQRLNELFNAELTARKRLVDVLWEERKNIEALLGRAGRGLSRFIYFDFRPTASPTEPEPEPPPAGDGGSTPPAAG